MPSPTIRNAQVACLRERDFYEYMHQTPIEDLEYQRDLVAQELSRHQDVRTPILELMRDRLMILNQATGAV